MEQLTVTYFVLYIELLKSPQTEYALIGENATFECHTRFGQEAYWVINDRHLSISFQETIQQYENMGVVFETVNELQYINLTLTIPASVDFNNTVISCTLFDAGFNQDNSLDAYLIVFDTLRKSFSTNGLCI